MSSTNKIPKQLFHGTNQTLSRGDVIVSRNAAGTDSPTVADEGGAEKLQELGHFDRAHATERLFTAGLYAERATRHLGGQFSIYRVVPVNPADVTYDHEGEWFSPSGFKVVRRLPFEQQSIAEMVQDPRMQKQHEQLEKMHNERR